MSHEIRQEDKQQGRKMGWHGLTQVKEDLSLENCWLNEWDYLPRAIEIEGMKTGFAALGVTDMSTTTDEDGNVIPFTIGNPYQIKTFKPVLNKVLIEKINAAIAGHGLTLESCGTVMSRGRLFLSFGLQGANFQAAGRSFEAFLNIGNGNDKSSPLWVNTSNVCTICNNTFTMNMSDGGMIMSVKKTQFSEFKLNDMGRAIKTMLSGQKEFAKQLGMLAKIECDENTARKFFAGFVGTPEQPLSTRAENNVERLVQLFKGGAGNDGNDFSDVFQSITDVFTHESASQKDDDNARWKNFVSSEFGAAKQAKIDGWSILNDEKARKGVIAMGSKILKLTAEAARSENAAK